MSISSNFLGILARRANKMLGRGETIEIPLFHMMWEEGKHAGKRIGLHACIINSEEENIHVAGVKAIPSTPANPRELGKPRSNGLVELFDEETGCPIAVVDDTLISGMRTSAGSGLGAKCFAREDSEVVGLIGSGIIAGYCLEATAMSMKNIKKVKIYDLIPENAQRFCEKFAHLGYEFEVVDSAEKTIRDSDIVHTCSLVDVGEEYVEPDWMKPSSFHSFVSQYDYKEACHLLPNVKFGMDWEDRLNDRDSCTLANMVLDGKMERPEITQVSDVLLVKQPGRTNPDDIYMFATIWLSVTMIAGAWVSFCIGSGFATGQELLQYFGAYGALGFRSIIVGMILHGYSSASFLKLGNEQHFHNPMDVFDYYCGKTFGKLFKLLSVFSCSFPRSS